MNNKSSAVLTNGRSGKRLTSEENKNAVWEPILMEQIAWYKKLNTPSPLSSVDPQMAMGRNYTTVS